MHALSIMCMQHQTIVFAHMQPDPKRPRRGTILAAVLGTPEDKVTAGDKALEPARVQDTPISSRAVTEDNLDDLGDDKYDDVRYLNDPRPIKIWDRGARAYKWITKDPNMSVPAGRMALGMERQEAESKRQRRLAGNRSMAQGGLVVMDERKMVKL